jgi:hypothetical protein
MRVKRPGFVTVDRVSLRCGRRVTQGAPPVAVVGQAWVYAQCRDQQVFSNQPLRMARASPARTISGFGDRHGAKRLPGINSKDNEGCAGCPIAHGCCEKWRARSRNMGTIASPWRYEGPSGPAKGHARLPTGRRRHYAESPKLRLRPVWARGGPVLSSAVVAAGRPARGSGRAISAPSPCSAPSCREELH